MGGLLAFGGDKGGAGLSLDSRGARAPVQFGLGGGDGGLGDRLAALTFRLDASVALVLQKKQQHRHHQRRRAGRDHAPLLQKKRDHRFASRASNHLIASSSTPHPAMNSARLAVSLPSTAAWVA